MDGVGTSFWIDRWTGSQSLAACFPALFSHCHRPFASLKDVLAIGIDNILEPRLSHCTSTELNAIRHARV